MGWTQGLNQNTFEAVALGTDQQGHNNISISCREYLFLQSSKPSTLKSQYRAVQADADFRNSRNL